MTTPARPGSFTGATDNSSSGGLFSDSLVDGIPDIVGADVASAQASATAAAASASSAGTSATAAAGSAVTATNASTTATDAASTASTDAATATTKAGEAAASATTASEAAIAAAEDAAAANESASDAAGSETAAAASQTAASTSAGNALTSATAANTAKLAAEAALALFTDAYIGAYASDAAADTAAGAALTEGDLYFNTVTDQMKVCSAVNAGTGTWLTLTPTAANQANINIVAGIETQVSDVAAIDTEVVAVAAIDTEVVAVAGDAVDIGTVATDLEGSDTIGTVASQITPTNNIQIVATAAPNISTVATDLSGSNTIGTVAADLSGSNTIGTVATDIADVNAVGTDLTGSDTIGTVATDLLGTNTIGTVATNLTGSDTIGTVATDIANINLVGPSITNVNTVAANIANVNTFANTYFVSATAPGSPTEGDLWFDTTANVMKVYNGIAWVSASSSVNGTAQRVNYTATAGQSTFAATYDVGVVDVYLNGIKLIETTDFTATNGTSIVLTSPAAVDDTVDIVGYGLFELANFSINDANDVNTAGITNGQTLIYNSTSGDLEAGTIPSPTLTSLGIANHNLLSVDSNGVLTLPDNYIVSGFEPTVPFDINSSGSVSSIDALYYNQWALGILTDFNIPTSETFKAPWSNTTILKGSLVEGNSADASRAASSLPSNNYGDTFILGNQDANNDLKSGLSINGHTPALISGADGESKLYKGTSQKLSTASTGISVTGDVSVTNGDLSEVLISQTIPSGTPTTIDFDNLPTTYDTYRFDFNIDVGSANNEIYVQVLNTSGQVVTATNAYFYDKITNGTRTFVGSGTTAIQICSSTSGANDNRGIRGSMYLYGRNMNYGSTAPTMPMFTWSLCNLNNTGVHETVTGGASLNPAAPLNLGSGMRGVRFYGSSNFTNQGFISVYGIRSTPV